MPFAASNRDLRIVVRDHSTTSAADFHARATLACELAAERWPHLPRPDVGAAAARLNAIGIPRGATWWLVRNASNQPAAWARFSPLPRHRREGSFDIYVTRTARRHGIARTLLASIVARAEHEGIERLCTTATTAVPAGMALVQQLGADAIVTRVSVDLPARRRGAGSDAPFDTPHGGHDGGFVVRVSAGPYDRDALAAIARLRSIVARSYGEDDAASGAEAVRLAHREHAALCRLDIERWTIYAVVAASGEIAAVNEFWWDAAEPTVLSHKWFAVADAYRGCGVEWLVTGQVDRLIRPTRPSIEVIRFMRDARLPDPAQHAATRPPRHYITTWRVARRTAAAWLGRRPAGRAVSA